jgi:hypothetical protein
MSAAGKHREAGAGNTVRGGVQVGQARVLVAGEHEGRRGGLGTGRPLPRTSPDGPAGYSR